MQHCLTPSVGLKAALSPSPLPSSLSWRCHHGHGCSGAPDQAPKISVTSTPRLPLPIFRLNVRNSTLAALLLPAAAACTVLAAYPPSVEAGILSGSTGLESFQLPSVPTPDLLKKIQEANVEKYKNFDANFRKSPFLQELLKKTKQNKEMGELNIDHAYTSPFHWPPIEVLHPLVQEVGLRRHRKEIEDKYCERGAEWGVGDCSLIGLPQADKDAFFENLRKGKARR